MDFRFEIGARVVPKAHPRARVGKVVDRQHCQHNLNSYLVEIEFADEHAGYIACHEHTLVRKTDG